MSPTTNLYAEYHSLSCLTHKQQIYVFNMSSGDLPLSDGHIGPLMGYIANHTGSNDEIIQFSVYTFLFLEAAVVS
jgi:hypothetical protein